jgi:hypothetical protein
MTKQVRKQAQEYIERSLKEQERLVYSASVDQEVYEAAVNETARAMGRMQKAQRRTRIAA